MRRRALIIDSDAGTRDMVRRHLEPAGFEVREVEDGRAGMEAAGSFLPDVILLELVLPSLSGAEVCRHVRAHPQWPEPAIIMLSARATEEDRVLGFESGIDDYMTKPFSVRELVLRVAAVLRRHRAGRSGSRRLDPANRYIIGPLKVDGDSGHVFAEGSEVRLTALEMRLLMDLVHNRGRVRSREDLLTAVWNYAAGVTTRTVDTHVRRLRDKLGPAGYLVETVRRGGYRLLDEGPDS